MALWTICSEIFQAFSLGYVTHLASKYASFLIMHLLGYFECTLNQDQELASNQQWNLMQDQIFFNQPHLPWVRQQKKLALIQRRTCFSVSESDIESMSYINVTIVALSG